VLEKWKLAFARDVTMANHPDMLANMYGAESEFPFVDPLPYGIYQPDTVTKCPKWKYYPNS